MYRLLLIFTFAITLLGYSCNDPITIGIPTNTDLDIIYTDTFAVKTKTVQGEVTSTYDLGVNYTTYLLGSLDDPFFGKSTSDIYVQIDFAGSLPDFTDAVLDSTVFIVEYAENGFYGDTLATFDVEIRRMLEIMDGDTTLSDKTWAIDPAVIGSRSFVPSRTDSITIASHLAEGVPINVGPQLRVPMTMDFGQELINASSENYSDSDALLEFINGFNISATPSSSSMMGLDFSDVSNFSGINKLRVYYTTPDTTKVFDFSFRSRTASSFTHDVEGYAMKDYLADEDFNGNDLAFFQGMSGVEAQFDFPSVDELKDKIINKAKLTYYSVSDPSETNMINIPVDIATLTYKNIDGERTLTSDASFGISPGPYTSILGGVPVLVDEANGIYQTTVNLTSHFNTIFNQDGISSSVVLTPLQRSERSSRTIIFGSGNVEYKPVLEVTYTDF